MFRFSQYIEGREIIAERPHVLDVQVYTYLSRWVIHDIHQERMDTQHRLHTEWVDQLMAWLSQEIRLQAILKLVSVLYILSTASLVVFTIQRDIANIWPIFAALVMGQWLTAHLFKSSKKRQQRIGEAQEATREMLELEASEKGLQKLSDIESETTCPKLKKYLEHHDANRLYMCQARGVMEYHQARILGETRG